MPSMKEYTRVLLSKSRENEGVARRSVVNGAANAAANRLYYAVYQAMLACLHHRTGYRAPAEGQHKEVLARFQAAFVDTGVFPAALMNRSFQMKNERIRADYKPTMVDPETAEELLSHAEAGVRIIESLLGLEGS